MWFGIFLVVCGLTLAVAPLRAARGASALRYVPYSSRPAVVRLYRLSGAALAAAGVVIAVIWG